MEPPPLGRSGRPGGRLRAQPGDPLDALGCLFDASAVDRVPPAPAVVPPAANRPPGDGAASPAAPIRLWWDDPCHRRPLPERQPPPRAEAWPRPAIPPDAPPPPYDGCRWPRACALLGRRLSCLSLLPCRCSGGELAAREAARAAGQDG